MKIRSEFFDFDACEVCRCPIQVERRYAPDGGSKCFATCACHNEIGPFKSRGLIEASAARPEIAASILREVTREQAEALHRRAIGPFGSLSAREAATDQDDRGYDQPEDAMHQLRRRDLKTCHKCDECGAMFKAEDPIKIDYNDGGPTGVLCPYCGPRLSRAGNHPELGAEMAVMRMNAEPPPEPEPEPEPHATWNAWANPTSEEP